MALTAGYFAAARPRTRHGPKFLWNAKMRFGKTFTTYQLAREMGWKRVLVLTYKPAVQTAWRDDLLGHVDFEGWQFVDRRHPATRATRWPRRRRRWSGSRRSRTSSGTTADGQIKAHNEAIHLTPTGTASSSTSTTSAPGATSARELYDPEDRRSPRTRSPKSRSPRRISGSTPTTTCTCRARRSGRSPTASSPRTDLQLDLPRRAAGEGRWDDADGPNPYIDLPGMEMYCYGSATERQDWAEDGEFNGFSLTEYFKASKVDEGSRSTVRRLRLRGPHPRLGVPQHAARQAVGPDEDADARRPEGTVPVRGPASRSAVRHSVWYLPDVASCFAMRDMLATHPSATTRSWSPPAQARQGAAAKPPVEKPSRTPTRAASRARSRCHAAS